MNGGSSADFQVALTKQLFPYWVQSSSKIEIASLTLYAGAPAADGQLAAVVSVAPPDLIPGSTALQALGAGLSDASGQAVLTLPPDAKVMLQYQFKVDA